MSPLEILIEPQTNHAIAVLTKASRSEPPAAPQIRSHNILESIVLPKYPDRTISQQIGQPS